MVTRTVVPGTLIEEHYGMSYDPKDTEDVPNASRFYEMDTGDVYMFDADSSTWILQ